MNETVKQFKQFAEQLSSQTFVATNERIDVLNATVWEFRYVTDPLAAQLCAQALQLAEQHGYVRGRAYALHNNGWYYVFTDQCQKAEQCFQESRQILLDLQDEAGLASTINGLATANRKTGDHAEALENFNVALQLREKIGDSSGVASILTNLGIVSARLGDYSLSLDYYYRALPLAIDSHATLVHSNLGDVLWRVGESALSIEHSQNALAAYQENSNQLYECMTLINLGAAHQSRCEYQAALQNYLCGFEIARQTDNFEAQAEAQTLLGSVYCEIGDWQTALIYLSPALQLARKISSRFYESETLLWLGTAYKQLGDVSQSIRALTEALHLSQAINANEIVCKAHLALSEAHQEQNQSAEALHHHQAFHQIWQEVFGVAASRRIGQLLLKWELEGATTHNRESKLLIAPNKTAKAVFGDQQNVTLAPRKLQEITNFVARHLEQNLTLTELADLTGLSQNCFLQAFKHATGKTPHQFVIEQRVARAQKLLQTTSLPLTEIALRCGFSSQSHLTTHFRLLTGTTPRQFQRSLDIYQHNKS